MEVELDASPRTPCVGSFSKSFLDIEYGLQSLVVVLQRLHGLSAIWIFADMRLQQRDTLPECAGQITVQVNRVVEPLGVPDAVVS